LTSLSIRQKVLEGFGILEGVLFGRRLRSCPTRQSVRIFKDKIFPNSLKKDTLFDLSLFFKQEKPKIELDILF
jgi:hypothetical protein